MGRAAAAPGGGHDPRTRTPGHHLGGQHAGGRAGGARHLRTALVVLLQMEQRRGPGSDQRPVEQDRLRLLPRRPVVGVTDRGGHPSALLPHRSPRAGGRAHRCAAHLGRPVRARTAGQQSAERSGGRRPVRIAQRRGPLLHAGDGSTRCLSAHPRRRMQPGYGPVPRRALLLDRFLPERRDSIRQRYLQRVRSHVSERRTGLLHAGAVVLQFDFGRGTRGSRRCRFLPRWSLRSVRLPGRRRSGCHLAESSSG
mmetsp:Transcript_8324/g.25782  ORF Transcript_8324/g.25782 Transcript_8324/m.25782 type:complete len:253 (-) Transcript_8324:1308-2066(-)